MGGPGADDRERWFATRCAVAVAPPTDAMWLHEGPPLGPEAIASAIAGALSSLHATPVDACPFPAGDDALTDRLRARVAAGVAVATDGPYAGRPPDSLVTLHGELIGAAAAPAPAVVHADLRADRVWCAPDGRLGFTGWRHAGVGDPHLDLAAAAAVVTELHGPALVGPLLDAYGLDRIDLRRLDAAQLAVHLLS